MLRACHLISIGFIALCCLIAADAKGQDTSKVKATIDSVKIKPVEDTINTILTVGDIRISGNKKTKGYIIQREVAFREGEALSIAELNKRIILSRQQLMNTSLFVDVEVKISRKVNSLAFIDVLVKERWYLFPLPYFKLIDRNLNQWWVEQKRSLNRVNYGLKFMQNNVSGRNDNLNFWLINGYTKQLSFRYENPFIDKSLKHGMSVGFSYSRNHEINYKTEFNKQLFAKDEDIFLNNTTHIDLGYSYRPAIKTRHNFRVAYTRQNVGDTVLALNPDFFKNRATTATFIDFAYNIQYFNVDYIPYPTRGFMGDASFYKRGWKGDNNIWQVGGRAEYIMETLPKLYVLFQAIGSIRLPFNQPYTSSKLFGSGDYYLRGLEYYVIDGVAGGMVRATPKKEVLSFSIRNPIGTKTHDKIPVRMFVKAFGDAAYSYSKNPGTSFLNNKWIYTYGAGVDIISFYDMVLKLEYSYNPYERSNKKWGFFIHTKSDF
jgi:outer membrane protein assembly factor BamA